MGKQVFLQPSVGANDVVVHYSISNQEDLAIDSQSINLKVGQKLVFVRNDQNTISERTMYEAGGAIDQDSNGNEFIAKAPGTSKITIIPNSYN